jgi:hypothetical protein
MTYDFKEKGAADFATGKKDLRLFHNTENHGRLYREGWHAARRNAEDEHAGQTPVADPVEVKKLTPPAPTTPEPIAPPPAAPEPSAKKPRKKKAGGDTDLQGSLF